MKGRYCKAGSFNFIRILLMVILTTALTACGGGSQSSENAEGRSSDRTPPSLQLVGSNIVNLSYNERYEELGATAIDNEDGTVPVTISGNVDTTTLGNQLIEYTAKDSAGNESKAIRIVVIYDQIPPAIQLNGDLEIITALDTPYQDQGATAIDEFDGIINPTVATDVNAAREGMYFVSYFATDTSGNTSTITRIVYVRDLTPPSIQLNGSSTIEINEDTPYTELGAITSDNLDTSVHLDINSMVDTSTPGNYTVTYTATDDNGNQSTATRTVIVLDTTPPVISLKGSSQLKINENVYYFEAGATATDNSRLPVSVSISGRVDTNVVGIYLVTYTSTDAAGNTATKTRTVEVLDITPPVITLIGDDEITIDEDSVYSEQGATVTDNVDTNLEISIESNLKIYTPGTYQVSYTATDSTGNTSSITRNIIIRDITPPRIVLFGDSPQYVNINSGFSDRGAYATDNKDSHASVQSSHDVDASIEGTYFVNYQSTDSAGNTAYLTRTVIVKDIQRPHITLNGEETITLSFGEEYVELGADVSDNVDQNLSITVISNVYTSAYGNYEVEYSATDSAGNQAIKKRYINVVGEFITTWKTDNPGESEDNKIEFQVRGENYNVDWGDGSSDKNISLVYATHTYDQPGTYTVKISGDLTGVSIGGYRNDAEKLLDIKQWGDMKWKYPDSAFLLCKNLIVTATDAPNLSEVTSLRKMFSGAEALTGDFNNWDISNITNMDEMFFRASNFNSDLSNWDVSNVTSMKEMFKQASVFNGDLSTWDVSNVKYMNSLFEEASHFNRDLSRWDVSSVEEMVSMFEEASNFESDLSSWNVSNLKDMRYIFSEAVSFTSDLSRWDVSSVTNMSGAFSSIPSFISDLSSWDVSNVTSTAAMFAGAKSFASDVSQWDVSNVENFGGMFARTDSFISDLSQWDVSKGKIFTAMFSQAKDFNSDISQWDVSSAERMGVMFNRAENFNQDLGNWDVSNVTTMFAMFVFAPLSTENYDSILLGWSQRMLQPNVDFHAGDSKYSSASQAARSSIISNYGWTITDGGLAPAP